MIAQPASRRFLVAGAWFATATVAFCLGRLTSQETKTGAAGVAKSAPALRTASETAGAAPDSGFADAATVGRINGGGIATARDLANGESLEDWLTRILKLDDEIARMTGFMRLLEVADASDLQIALKVLQETSKNWGRSREFPMLMQKWTQLDPVAAADFILLQTDRAARSTGTRSVFTTWARLSPQEAIGWSLANGVTTGRDRTDNWPMAVIVSEIAGSDPEWAFRLAQEQPRSEARGAMIGAIVSGLLEQGDEAGVRAQVLALTDESLRNGMISNLVSRTAHKDPAGTAAWVQKLPEGETRERAFTVLIDGWAEKDLAAAAAYLTQYAPSADTDRARQEIAQAAVRKDPESALAWAGSITQENVRVEALSSVVRRWFRSDANAAQAWLDGSGMSAELRAKMMGFR